MDLKVELLLTFRIVLHFHDQVVSTLSQDGQRMFMGSITHVDPTHLYRDGHDTKLRSTDF